MTCYILVYKLGTPNDSGNHYKAKYEKLSRELSAMMIPDRFDGHINTLLMRSFSSDQEEFRNMLATNYFDPVDTLDLYPLFNHYFYRPPASNDKPNKWDQKPHPSA